MALHSSDDRDFVPVMLAIYQAAAAKQLAQAEASMARALDLRDNAMAMLDRAAGMAMEYAKAEDDTYPDVWHDEIDW